MNFVDPNTVGRLLPEIILVLMASWMYIGGTFNRSRVSWSLIALMSYIVAAVALFRQSDPSDLGPLFTNPLVVDSLSYAGRWVALAMGVLFTLLAMRSAPRQLASEFLATLMLVVVGVMLVCTANDLILLFLGLELISIPTYILLFLGRRDRATAEATVKYFFLSILSSALLLYGFSFLYGMSGTTLIESLVGTASMRDQIEALKGNADGLAQFGPLALILVLAGLGFKIAAVPFHFYAPDVYQGTSNGNAALLAVVPKIAGVVALVRLVPLLLPVVGDFAWQATMVVALLTMTIGNVCALWQKNFRRLMAYSSIAHAGYMLIGLSVAVAAAQARDVAGEQLGLSALLFYLLVYAFASLGAFATVAWLGDEEREIDGVDELAGLVRSQPRAAAALAAFMFSLAGIPPLAGFWGKFTLFGSAISLAGGAESGSVRLWFTVLAIVAAINAAIAAAYYLRVIGVMFFQPSVARVPAAGGYGKLVTVTACTIAVVLIGVRPHWIVDPARQAADDAAYATAGDEPAAEHLAADPAIGE